MAALAEPVENNHARRTQSTRRPRTQLHSSLQNSAVGVIAGPFAQAVIRTWSEERIGEYLGASDTRRHLWHACLASEHPHFQPRSLTSCERLYRQFKRARGKDLVVQAFGCRPPGLLSALGRLGAEARTPETYRALVRALEQGGAVAKCLMHSRYLPDALIHALANLPPAMNTKRLISLVTQGKIAPGDLAAFAWTAERLGETRGPDVYRALISAKKPMDALVDVLVGGEFPNPPWPGTVLFKPVTSRAQLQRIGVDFANCLRHRYWASRESLRIINGAKFFYEWVGSEPALVSFVRVQNVGWFLDEVEGAYDNPVSENTRREIIGACSTAPEVCPFQPDKFYGWDQESAFVEAVSGCLL